MIKIYSYLRRTGVMREFRTAQANQMTFEMLKNDINSKVQIELPMSYQIKFVARLENKENH